MAAEDIKILVTEYNWAGSVNTPIEASIFSGKAYATSRASFDLMDYLLDDDLVIRWGFESIRDDHSPEKLLPMGSELSMKLSNADGALASYFRILSGTAFIKWECLVYYKSKLVHKGWITPEGIEYAEGSGTGSDTHVLIIRVKDYITELKDYYVNQPLKNNNEVNWEEVYPIGSFGINYSRFGFMLAELFPGVSFSLSSGIYDMKVMETAYFAVFGDSSWAWWKSGYERVFTNGENKWDWLRKLCNGMGFVLFSYIDPADQRQKIGIKNRSDANLPVHTLDPDAMIEYTRSKEHNNSIYDAVIINNGTMMGGDFPYSFIISGSFGQSAPYKDLKGGRTILVSEKYPANYNCAHFKRPFRTDNLIRLYWEGHNIIKYKHEDSNNFYLWNVTGGLTPDHPHKTITIPKDRILFLDTGDQGNYAMKLQMNTNSYNTGHTIGETNSDPETAHYELIYTGNYGEMLTGIPGAGGAQTYEDYIKSSQFKANFRPFISKPERFSVEYVHSGVITDPYHKITGSTGQSILFGRFWDITAMETDLINEVTIFELLGQKFQFLH